MLVLTREPGEAISIGPDVEVRVLAFRYANGRVSQVKLGITAPKDTVVLRTELQVSQKMTARYVPAKER